MSRSSSSGCCRLVIFQHTWNATPGERSDLTWTGWEKVGPNEQLSERVTEWECTNVWLHVGPWCVMTITMEVWSPGPGLFLSLTWLSQCFQHTHTKTLFLHSTKRPPGCTHTQVTFKCPHLQFAFVGPHVCLSESDASLHPQRARVSVTSWSLAADESYQAYSVFAWWMSVCFVG